MNNKEWQPIETAPLKTWIIVLFPNERPMTFIFMNVDDKINTLATHWTPYINL